MVKSYEFKLARGTFMRFMVRLFLSIFCLCWTAISFGCFVVPMIAVWKYHVSPDWFGFMGAGAVLGALELWYLSMNKD